MRTLVLNQDYQPLNICSDRRAYVLVDRGKADLVSEHRQRFRLFESSLARPSVIRMRYYVRRPPPGAKLGRRELFARDDHTCQYCGSREAEFTVDHVLPKRLGGPGTWENLVTSCRRCNLRKGGKTLSQAGMRLRRRPQRPLISMHRMVQLKAAGREEPGWRQFLYPGNFAPKLEQSAV